MQKVSSRTSSEFTLMLYCSIQALLANCWHTGIKAMLFYDAKTTKNNAEENAFFARKGIGFYERDNVALL